MFLQERTRWKWAYPPHYKRALAFSILPYLNDIVMALQASYPLQQESNRLTKFRSNNRSG